MKYFNYIYVKTLYVCMQHSKDPVPCEVSVSQFITGSSLLKQNIIYVANILC